jgi:hypothetical protein
MSIRDAYGWPLLRKNIGVVTPVQNAAVPLIWSLPAMRSIVHGHGVRGTVLIIENVMWDASTVPVNVPLQSTLLHVPERLVGPSAATRRIYVHPSAKLGGQLVPSHVPLRSVVVAAVGPPPQAADGAATDSNRRKATHMASAVLRRSLKPNNRARLVLACPRCPNSAPVSCGIENQIAIALHQQESTEVYRVTL